MARGTPDQHNTNGKTDQDNNIIERVESSSTVKTVEKDVRPVQAFLTKFNNDWSMNFSGLLAYSLLTAMLPIAIAIVGVLGFILGNAGLQQTIISHLGSVVPGSASQQAIDLAFQQLRKQAGILLVIAILLAIFGGSRLFVTVEGCLDIIYRVRPRKFIRQNLMALGMLVLFIILVPIMVFASGGPTYLLSLINNLPVLKSVPFFYSIATSPIIVYLTGIVGGLIAAFILFEAIYFVVPNQHISWRNSWCGALVAAVAMEIFLVIIFPFYATHFLGGYAGQIGFAVVLLIFLYYFAVILMLGAEVNAFFFEKVRPLPNDLATFVSTMAGKLNRDIPPTELEAHLDTKPTDTADRAHIAQARDQEEQNQQENMRKQNQIVAQNLARDKSKAKGDSSRLFSNLSTKLEVVIGSMLALAIEWLRLRRQRE